MSWMKRRGQPSPAPPASGVPLYNPNQHMQPQQWQQNFQSGPQQFHQQIPPQQQSPLQQYNSNWYNQQPTSGVPPPIKHESNNHPMSQGDWQPPQLGQQQAQNYSQSQQGFSNVPLGPTNANQYPHQQQPYAQQNQQYYQNTIGFNNLQPNQNYVPNYANQQQSAHHNMMQPAGNNGKGMQESADPWNWNWGDDTNNTNGSKPTTNQNFNNIEDSFNVTGADDSWNWTVEDSNSSSSASNSYKTEIKKDKRDLGQNQPQLGLKQEQTTTIQPNRGIHQQPQLSSLNENKTFEEGADEKPVFEQMTQSAVVKHRENSEHLVKEDENVMYLEQMPPVNTGRRGLKHSSDSLTPQWSIESQVSQDSSDDVLQTSDSNKLSRSSTISQCPSLPNSSGQPDFEQNADDHQKHFKQEIDEEQWSANIQSQIAEVSNAIENYTLQHSGFENKEIIAPESSNSMYLRKTATPLSNSAGRSSQQPLKNPTPPLIPVKNSTPPLMPPKNASPTPPPPSKVNIDGSSSIHSNPYKRTTAGYKVHVSTNLYQDNQPQLENLGVNLETVPDNVERPDVIPVDLSRTSTNHKINSAVHQQWPTVENLEVAPKNDRNQYLETGQLSDSDLPDYQQNEIETNSEEPPPGLRRMVLGRTETELTITPGNVNAAEPRILTGLDRVVDGQPENVITQNILPTTLASTNQNNDGVPVGLHRMVPGESSSPETNVRWNYLRSTTFDDDDTEVELQNIDGNLPSRPTQRSETIGADTPPSNQAGLVDPVSANRDSAVGRDSVTPDARETNVDGADTQFDLLPVLNDTNRNNEPINVQTRARSQTDGENTRDNNARSQSKESLNRNRGRITDSSEEDREVRESSVDRRRNKSPGRYEKDRKYYERRGGESPDRYWDRRRRDRDRYYEEETDYYSDKERKDRRSRDNRGGGAHRDEYDRIYSSLKRMMEREGRTADYDRMYNSLRREMDRNEKSRSERDRGSRNEYDRDGRRDDYYYGGRYDDDYYSRDSRSSRPSSRSDSNYRDRVEHRSKRDPYNSYYQGFGYDPAAMGNSYYAAQYQQHYQYYENLRRTNPAAYAEWYRKYLQSYGAVGGPPSSNGGDTSHGYRGHDDKASVHSGRSSANDELHKDRYAPYSYYSGCSSEIPHMTGYYSHSHSYSQDDSRMLDHTDSSLNLEDTNSSLHRLTPAKFSTAHVKANISSGRFIRILPHYPLDGQLPIVELVDFQDLLADDCDQQELMQFPGPLIKGVTHKKTIIEYCENKIRKANSCANFTDCESYILMWELLILLLRQNGVVVGTDIAELLMKNSTSSVAPSGSRRPSVVSSIGSVSEDVNGENEDNTSMPTAVSGTTQRTQMNTFNETYVTNKFREYLIYGSGKEALEWAMKHGLWGHALFLASKLDKRTYANVMMRFANGLTINDPLQTLYQLLSGRQPAAVTCVSDEKWGDWRPHLAMILSNTTQRPELDRKAITTLGDTLLARGSLYAAHFCYLMAQTGFGRYGSKSSRLVLLGSSHQKPFIEFATNEAIIMTEIYEYACSLNESSFNIVEFQPYKYLLATRLAERGFFERALLYSERIGFVITQNPTQYNPQLTKQVITLAERLRAHDPTNLTELQLDSNNESDDEQNSPAGNQNMWISQLKTILSEFDMGLIKHEIQSLSNFASSEVDIAQSVTPPTSDQQNQHSVQHQTQPVWNQQSEQQPIVDQQQYYQQTSDSSYAPQNWLSPEQNQQKQFDQQNQQQNSDYQQTAVNQTAAEYQQLDQQNQYWNQQWNNSGEPNSTINDQQSMYQQQSIGDQNDLYNNENNNYWNSTNQQTNREIKPLETTSSSSCLPQSSPPVSISTTNNTITERKLAPPTSAAAVVDDVASSKPQITMPNSISQSSTMYDDNDAGGHQLIQSKSATSAPKKAAKDSASKQTSSSGWFGGIWNKLSLRPKNQMILPDDKNPTIVWDQEKKKWVNLEGDSDESGGDLKPPPKMTDLYPKMGMQPHQHNQMNGSAVQSIPLKPANQQPMQQQFPSSNFEHLPNNNIGANLPSIVPSTVESDGNAMKPPPVPNMFKMQRDRGVKKAYVDVFNPGGTKSGTLPNTANVLGLNQTATNPTQMNYFVPAPVNDPNAPVDFLTPSTGFDANLEKDNSQLSRWSSSSSLSREVQRYMTRSSTSKHSSSHNKNKQINEPAMYNPNQYSH